MIGMLTVHAPNAASVSAPGAHSPRAMWMTGWLGLASLGVANGALREVSYQRLVGERTGHQVSTFTLLAMVAGCAGWLQRRWPLTSDAEAVEVGAAWAALTVAFEFSFGHYVAGSSFEELSADYDLTAGNLWALVPLGIAVAPVAARHFRQPTLDR